VGEFIKGDVVVIPFPFSDLSDYKRRPAVILADLPGDDFIMSQITSKNVSDNMSISLEPDEIEGGELSATSNIRPNKLFTADKGIVLYKIGAIDDEKLGMVINKVIKIFTA
jgi:mRNA interferase MazF